MAPTTGFLKKQRGLAFVEAGGTPRYIEQGFDYDAYGNPTKSISYDEYATANASPAGAAYQATSAYESTYNTYLTSTTNPLGHSTSIVYDYSLGLPLSVEDANGVKTGVAYDALGRMIRICAPLDWNGSLPCDSASATLGITYYNYSSSSSPFGVVLSQKLDSSRTMRFAQYYNGLGQKIQSQSIDVSVDGVLKNVVTDTQYDKFGRAVKQTIPYVYNAGAVAFQPQTFSQLSTTSTYDILGRVTSVAPPNGNAVSTSYSELSVSQTDAKGATTTSSMNVWGQVLSVQPPAGPQLSYTYDPLGRLEKVTKGSAAPYQTETEIFYDLAGRKIAMNDPDMGDWSYAYDARGSLVSQTDARNCVSNLQYDALGRLTLKSFSGPGACASTPEIRYFYDGQNFSFLGNTYGGGGNVLGRRTGMTDGSGAATWAYDARGRVTQQTKFIFSGPAQAEAFSTSWTYNSADLPVTSTDPDGETLTTTYNSQGLPVGMTNNDAQPFTYVNAALYDRFGQVTSLALGNNGGTPLVQRAYTYNDWNTDRTGGMLQQILTTGAGADTLQSLAYDYDRNANITSIQDGRNNETSLFGYDSLNRLTSATVQDAQAQVIHNEAFVYDLAGRMSQKNGQAFTYDDNHPHAVAALGGNAYEYDANGNQVVRSIDGQDFQLVYDAENRLVAVQAIQPPAPTPTATAIFTETSTPTETESATPTPEWTSTYTPTAVSTNSPTATLDSGSTPTETPTPGDPTPTATPDGSATPEETATPTDAFTATPTFTPPASSTVEMTPTATATPSDTPAPTHTATHTATLGPTPMPTEPTPAPLQEASYLYDGDGNMVRGTVNGVITYYPARGYNKQVDGIEVTIQKHYTIGSQTIALRVNGALNWVLGDHLGSTSVTANANGSFKSQIQYTAFGEIRASLGVTESEYRYTGQLRQAELGLYYYVARWYDPYLNHFTQPDSIVPEQTQGTQAWDRYAYVNNNPLKYTDPTGHQASCEACNLWEKARTAFMQFVGRTYVYKSNQASNLGELMTLAFFGEPEAEIIGSARDDIAADPVLLKKQDEVVKSIIENPLYGKDEFSLKHTWSITFGEMGNKNMFEDAAQSQTWTVRAATVKSTFNVYQSGDIRVDYLLIDTLDLKPDWHSGARTGTSGTFYNITTQILEPLWHGILGASYMDTNARWRTNIPKER